MNQKIYIGIGAVLIFLFIFAGIWFFFFRSTTTVSTNGTTSGSFGSVPDTANTAPASTDTSGTQTINTTTTASAQKIFEITAGPIVGATLIQTLRPTTTIARYIRQDDGHVFDVPLGIAGAVPRVVSNITIPGGQRAIWLEGGNAALVQYVDDTNVVKTVYLGFPTATTTSALQSTRIQFLPDNIIDIAGSPDGKSVVYLIKTAGGSDGYIARDDGANSKKTFSLPLSQLLISWPSPNTMLAQTKSAVGVTGMVFSIDVKSGATTQLVAAAGLTAIADPTFSHVIYQTADGVNQPSSYSNTIKNSLNTRLSFNPFPEQCIWSTKNTSVMYCANPQTPTTNYLDLWHQGAIDGAEGIFSYNLSTNNTSAIAIPGSADGGTSADILEMALSPDEHYLSYTTKGDRALWGVLLSN